MKLRTLLRCSATSGCTSSVQHTSAATLKDVLRHRDITLCVPSVDGRHRITFCSSQHLLTECIRRHDLLVATQSHLPFLELLGTSLSFTNLLAAQHEGEERIDVQLTADEATIFVEAMALGECRCRLGPDYNAKVMESGVAPFLLRVGRTLYGQTQAFTSRVHAEVMDLCATPPTLTGEDAPPPISLRLDDLLATPRWCRELEHLFSYNMMLHAYHFLRRSDGSSSAVWAHTGMLPSLVANNTSSSSPTSKCVATSFGVMATPLAAGTAADHAAWHLQRALVRGSLSQEDGAPPLLLPLYQRAAEMHISCQDSLSLMTGDYDGAYAAATKARQPTQDPATVAALVEPLRASLHLHRSDNILLHADGATRTGIDFFCRCNTADLLKGLVGAPEELVEKVMSQGSRCTYCNKELVLSPEEWATLQAHRRAQGCK